MDADTQSDDGVTLTPRRIAGVYLLFGIAWILLSDALLWATLSDSQIRLRVEAAKGVLFVCLSALLLYWLSARAQRAQHRAWAELRDRTRELSIFHRIVRHNLRNIATVIVGRTETARRAADPEPHLAVVERKAERLETLAEKASLLRNVSRQGACQRVEQDLAKSIRDVAERYRGSHPGADIAVETPERFETMVPSRFSFAVSELVENALVHGGTAPSVTVSLCTTEETVEITVADNGPGIPDVERTAIEGDIEGSFDHSEGIGLWLARLIVENAGGRVEIVTTATQGAAIRLAFPRIDPESVDGAVAEV